MDESNPISLESVSQESLRGLGFRDPERALRILRSLPGQGVPDELADRLLPSLFESLRRSPDPDRALNNFERWTSAVTSRYTHFQLLLHHPAALDIFFNVCGTSQFFSDILVRNPEYVEILTNPRIRESAKSAGTLYAELSRFIGAIQSQQFKLEAMRRFKQREILRIGVRDILEIAPMPIVAREFSDLADACVQIAFEVASDQLADRIGQSSAFAVVAMGKLGGQELNYSSDIDLMFVMEDERNPSDVSDLSNREPTTSHESLLTPAEDAQKLAESIIKILSSNLHGGHLFRVDLRLRPEGRFGPLVRTLSSYRAYYESWAEPWELQALIKARFVAGDARLGADFVQMIEPYVYRRAVTSKFTADIRANKRRIEQKAEIEGQSHKNVKIGIGGIRDIEFTVQLVQLRLGGRYPILRTPNTLEALARLRQLGLLADRESDDLSSDYQFLRTVEHRLQILYDLQTQLLPASPEERFLLARRLGFRDRNGFDEEFAVRTARVRDYLRRLFYETAEEQRSGESWQSLLLNIKLDKARVAIEERLRAAGFRDPGRIASSMRTAVAGSSYGKARPESRSLFPEIAGGLIESAARTGDPDAAYVAVDGLATDSPNRAEFYQALLGSQELLDRLCVLAAGSPPTIQSLSRHPEWLDILVSDEIVDPSPKSAEEMASELGQRLNAGARDVTDEPGNISEREWQAIATYVQRERLRIAARDLWGEIGSLAVGRELTNLAEAVLQTLLSLLKPAVLRRFPDSDTSDALNSVAIIGLGKGGAGELGYNSDLDILLVYSDSPSHPLNHSPSQGFSAVNALAESLLRATQELSSRGASFQIDPRLRPEGKFGALARSVEESESYYRESALTWERQTLTRARLLAGSQDTGQEYIRIVHRVLYERPLTAIEQQEIQDMKRRIEKERLKPEDAWTDIKLGHGGMSDIEFTAQLYQMREGFRRPDLRSSNTVDTLHALGAAGVIPSPEATHLADVYTRWTAVRNRLALRGVMHDRLPAEPSVLRPIAIGLGFGNSTAGTAEDQFQRQFTSRMRETRQIFDRLFYNAKPIKT